MVVPPVTIHFGFGFSFINPPAIGAPPCSLSHHDLVTPDLGIIEPGAGICRTGERKGLPRPRKAVAKNTMDLYMYVYIYIHMVTPLEYQP